MASSRDAAKRDLIEGFTDTNESSALKAAFTTAQEQQHRITQEKNRNKEEMRRLDIQESRDERGAIGNLLGGKENSPIAITAIAVIFGIVGCCICYVLSAVLLNRNSGPEMRSAPWLSP